MRAQQDGRLTRHRLPPPPTHTHTQVRNCCPELLLCSTLACVDIYFFVLVCAMTMADGAMTVAVMTGSVGGAWGGTKPSGRT